MPHSRRKRGPAQPRLERKRTYSPGEQVVAHGCGATSGIPVETAIDLVNAGCAEWINDSKEIRVFRSAPHMDASLEMTLGFMEGVANGDPFCMKLWKMRQESKARKLAA